MSTNSSQARDQALRLAEIAEQRHPEDPTVAAAVARVREVYSPAFVVWGSWEADDCVRWGRADAGLGGRAMFNSFCRGWASTVADAMAQLAEAADQAGDAELAEAAEAGEDQADTMAEVAGETIGDLGDLARSTPPAVKYGIAIALGLITWKVLR